MQMIINYIFPNMDNLLVVRTIAIIIINNNVLYFKISIYN